MTENINHPSHYNSGSIETIDYIESLGFGYAFCIGNAIKYLSRAEHKGTQVEDLKKAVWYINRAIEKVEKDSPLYGATAFRISDSDNVIG